MQGRSGDARLYVIYLPAVVPRRAAAGTYGCSPTLCHRRYSHQALFASLRYATGAVRILYLPAVVPRRAAPGTYGCSPKLCHRRYSHLIFTGCCAPQGGSGDVRLYGRVRVDSTDVANWSRAEQRLRQYLYFCTRKASKLSNSCVSICVS